MAGVNREARKKVAGPIVPLFSKVYGSICPLLDCLLNFDGIFLGIYFLYLCRAYREYHECQFYIYLKTMCTVFQDASKDNLFDILVLFFQDFPEEHQEV